MFKHLFQAIVWGGPFCHHSKRWGDVCEQEGGASLLSEMGVGTISTWGPRPGGRSELNRKKLLVSSKISSNLNWLAVVKGEGKGVGSTGTLGFPTYRMDKYRDRNRLTDVENRLVVAKGEGVGWTGRLGLVDANDYI